MIQAFVTKADAVDARRRMRGVACAVLLVIGSTTAACATTYGPMGFWTMGGYTDTRIDSTTYRIGFAANAYTSRDIVENYALFRCAELTVTSGNDYFVVVSGDTDKYQEARAYGANATVDNKFASTMTIKVFKGQKPSESTNAYDAREVMKNLGEQIKR